MKHIPIKLGPLALLLTVISICMTVLGLLSFTTARADLRLAEKYGDTVKQRYELEAEGQKFLGEAGRALDEASAMMESSGGLTEEDGAAVLAGLEGVEPGEDGVIRKILTKDGFTLTVGIVPDREGGIRIVDWSIQKEWEPDSDIGNLWSGE